MASTTEDVLLLDSTELLSTTEQGPVVLGVAISGLELTLFYMALNVLMLFIILIMAWHTGNKQVKEAKRKKRAESREKVRDDEKYDGQDIEMGAANQPGGAGHVSNDVSAHMQRQISDLSARQKVQEFFMAFIHDIMNRSFIYSAFLVHVWDQGSDIGVIYTWFTEDDGQWEYLAYISIGVLLNYRIFSAYSLRQAQRGWRDTILQALDCQLFVDVYRSTRVAKPNDSLYWIRAMEAVLESCLQILLQFVYLYQATNIFVWLSLFGSMASVVFSLMHYADVIFLGRKGFIFWMGYFTRFTFRACEVTSRCMVLALIWSTWNSEDHKDKTGTMIVGVVLGLEAIFYALLTQFRIPPWEIAAFLVVNIDLTLTFEGRVGALTQPLKNNPLYRCICKPVAEMFTKIEKETEEYFEEHHRRTSTMHDNTHKPSMHTGYSNESAASTKRGKRDSVHGGHTHHGHGPQRQKLLIAPAHYVYRFLEGIFQIFCVITYGVLYPEIWERLFEGDAAWKLMIAAITTIITPILYCTVRIFADESQTLERNLIAMVYHAQSHEDTQEIIKLVGSGASLKQTDFEGNNVVHACIHRDNMVLLERILRKYKEKTKSFISHGGSEGKSMNIIDDPNDKGFTPVMLAAKVGSLECLKMLAEIEEIDFNKAQEVTGQYLVHIAAQHDEDAIIEYLASLGKTKCDLEKTYTHWSENGEVANHYTALHVAAAHNSIKAFEVLLDLNQDWRARLSNQDTCAHLAAQRGHLVILHMLHEKGDKFDVRGNHGHTPLFRAAFSDHPGTVEVIGGNPPDGFGCGDTWHVPDAQGVHIDIKCFQMRMFSVLSSLAHLGVRFDRCGKWLEVEITAKGPFHHLTALMWACKQNEPVLVKTLLDAGANKNHVNKFNETAAHHAAAMGSLNCLKLLQQYSANFNLTNNAGQTPYDKAVQQKQKEIIKWFTENKGKIQF